MKGQNLETKRQKEKMVSQGACKLALSCLQKNLPHFSWRIAWDKITGMAIQDYWSRALQSPSQQKSKPIPKQGCTQVDAATLVPGLPSAFLTNSSCHQWYFESQNASHSAFQLSSLSVAGLLTHPFPLSFCQLNKLLTSPPSSCAAHLFTLLT